LKHFPFFKVDGKFFFEVERLELRFDETVNGIDDWQVKLLLK